MPRNEESPTLKEEETTEKKREGRRKEGKKEKSNEDSNKSNEGEDDSISIPELYREPKRVLECIQNRFDLRIQ